MPKSGYLAAGQVALLPAHLGAPCAGWPSCQQQQPWQLEAQWVVKVTVPVYSAMHIA